MFSCTVLMGAGDIRPVTMPVILDEQGGEHVSWKPDSVRNWFIAVSHFHVTWNYGRNHNRSVAASVALRLVPILLIHVRKGNISSAKRAKEN